VTHPIVAAWVTCVIRDTGPAGRQARALAWRASSATPRSRALRHSL